MALDLDDWLHTASAVMGIVMGITITFADDLFALGAANDFQWRPTLDALERMWWHGEIKKRFDLLPMEYYVGFAVGLFAFVRIVSSHTRILFFNTWDKHDMNAKPNGPKRAPPMTVDNMYIQRAATAAEARKLRQEYPSPRPVKPNHGDPKKKKLQYEPKSARQTH